MTLRYPDGGFLTSNSSVYVLFEKDGKYAFIKRAHTGWMDGYYGLPAGRVDHGESFTQAAIREAKEEVGADLTEADIEPVMTWQRHHDDGDWVDVVFRARSWKGELYNAEPEIHSELAWLDPTNLGDDVIPGLRLLFTELAAGKTLVEFGWN
jgi:8-oxo-dGTP pyrophosphatase MutT (NUDIX family)